MGAKTQRSVSYQQQQAGQATLLQAQQQQAYNERVLGAAQQMLGTEEQVAGYGEDSRLSAYTQRYSVNEQQLSDWLNSSSKLSRRGGQIFESAQAEAGQANALMDQAEAAARAGNWDEAERLRTQAGSMLGGRGSWQGGGRGKATSASFYTLGGGDVGRSARSLLTGPQAQIVGRQVQEAKQYQDWGSEASQQWRARMAEGGERAIAAEAQSALRSARDFGLQRGAGRMAGAAAAIGAETLRRAATERAQVHSQVNQAFEGFRHQFAQSAVSFAQSWLSGQAGVRDAAQAASAGMSSMIANMYGGGAQLASGFSAQAAQEAQAAQAKRGALYGAALTAVGGVAGAIAGGPMGAAIGAKLGGSVAGGGPTQG